MEMVSVILSVHLVSGALADCNPLSHLFITAPKTMEALSGSCLMIPCNFSTEPEDQSFSPRAIYGVWIKNDLNFGQNRQNVIYNSSKTDNIYPMNLTGNLRQRQCTTLFSDLTTAHTDRYYFRVENELFKATAVCDPLQINVTDSPPQPTINVPGDLRENTSVAITCSASTPCPLSAPKLTWTLQPQPHHHTEENADGTFTTKVQQTISLSDQYDGLNISCSASYAVTGGDRTAGTVVTLSVSYAPKNTSASISPSGSVSAGSRVNLTCSSRAKPPVSSFTWFRISTDGAANVSVGALYTFNATGGAVYYCEASNALGAQTSPLVHLTIAGTEQLFPLGAAVAGSVGALALLCVVVVTWWLKSKNRSPQTQALTDEGPKTEDETIHYGEINISSLRREPDWMQSSEQQQDTVYAQVTVAAGGSRFPQAASNQDDLYANVH